MHFASDKSLFPLTSPEAKVVEEIPEKRSYRLPLFLPENPYRRTWEVISMLFIIYSSVTVPYLSFFRVELSPESGNYALFVLEVLVYVVFCLDIIFAFFFSYLDKEGQPVRNHKQICLHYLRTWFLIDIVSILPFQFLSNSMEESELTRLLRIPRLLQLLRLVRLVKVFAFLIKIQRSLRRQLTPAYSRVIFTWVVSFFMIHFSTCLWWFVGEQGLESGNTNWIESYGVEGSPQASQYLASLYYVCCTIASLGPGDITPKSDPERVLAVGFIIGGGVWFAFILHDISMFLREVENSQREINLKRSQIMQFCRHYHLPRMLQSRMLSSFEAIASGGHGRLSTSLDPTVDKDGLEEFMREESGLVVDGTRFEEDDVLTCVGADVRMDVLLEKGKRTLRCFPALRKHHKRVQATFLRSMQQRRAFSNEVIAAEGTYGDCMYLLEAGAVSLSHKGIHVADYTSGAIFGEIDCLFAPVRVCTVHARRPCTYYTIDKEIVHSVCEQDPEFAGFLLQIARIRGTRYETQTGLDLNMSEFFSLSRHHHHAIGKHAKPDDPAPFLESDRTTVRSTAHFSPFSASGSSDPSDQAKPGTSSALGAGNGQSDQQTPARLTSLSSAIKANQTRLLHSMITRERERSSSGSSHSVHSTPISPSPVPTAVHSETVRSPPRSPLIPAAATQAPAVTTTPPPSVITSASLNAGAEPVPAPSSAAGTPLESITEAPVVDPKPPALRISSPPGSTLLAGSSSRSSVAVAVPGVGQGSSADSRSSSHHNSYNSFANFTLNNYYNTGVLSTYTQGSGPPSRALGRISRFSRSPKGSSANLHSGPEMTSPSGSSRFSRPVSPISSGMDGREAWELARDLPTNAYRSLSMDLNLGGAAEGATVGLRPHSILGEGGSLSRFAGAALATVASRLKVGSASRKDQATAANEGAEWQGGSLGRMSIRSDPHLTYYGMGSWNSFGPGPLAPSTPTMAATTAGERSEPVRGPRPPSVGNLLPPVSVRGRLEESQAGFYGPEEGAEGRHDGILGRWLKNRFAHSRSNSNSNSSALNPHSAANHSAAAMELPQLSGELSPSAVAVSMADAAEFNVEDAELVEDEDTSANHRASSPKRSRKAKGLTAPGRTGSGDTAATSRTSKRSARSETEGSKTSRVGSQSSFGFSKAQNASNQMSVLDFARSKPSSHDVTEQN